MSSWLYRLAHANFTKAHTFCRFHLKGFQIWNRDIDKSASPNLLYLLSELTGVEYKKLKNLTLWSYDGYLFEKCQPNSYQQWITPLKIFHRSRKGFGLQFCPRCLGGDGNVPYFRKHWRLSTSVACTTCKTLLHDRCPFCGSPIIFFRHEIGTKNSYSGLPLYCCHLCKNDLRESPLHPPKIGTIAYQLKINRYLNLGYCDHIQYSLLYFNVLAIILRVITSSRPKYQSFQVACCIPENHAQKVGTTLVFDSLSTLHRENYLQIACWILENWPTRFLQICSMGKCTSYLFLSEHKVLPYWFYSIIKKHIYFPTRGRHLA